MKFGIVRFPGSNCDQDVCRALDDVLGQEVRFIWHKDQLLGDVDCVVLPGGFSFGDYLRSGAIARFSPAMKAVAEFADAGGLVLGICNGFQILCEAGLLPGAFMRNQGLKFVCDRIRLRVETVESPFTNACQPGQILHLPIAHAEGCYFADASTLETLRRDNRVLLRYLDNPNGSVDDIAGICNQRRNVFGLMPHPERACESLLGGEDGQLVFKSIIATKAAVPSVSA